MSKSILSSVMMITRYKRISTTACVKNPINISLTSSPPCFLINTLWYSTSAEEEEEEEEEEEKSGGAGKDDDDDRVCNRS